MQTSLGPSQFCRALARCLRHVINTKKCVLGPALLVKERLSMHQLFQRGLLAAVIFVTVLPLVAAVSSQTYTWNNVKIGGGGGFVPNIIFNPSEQGLAYARTDIGGAYKLNADDSWTPLLDFANDTTWHYWGTDALATDPVDTERLYLVRKTISPAGIH